MVSGVIKLRCSVGLYARCFYAPYKLVIANNFEIREMGNGRAGVTMSMDFEKHVLSKHMKSRTSFSIHKQ